MPIKALRPIGTKVNKKTGSVGKQRLRKKNVILHGKIVRRQRNNVEQTILLGSFAQWQRFVVLKRLHKQPKVWATNLYFNVNGFLKTLRICLE